jgi:hypothetical protein
MLRNAGAEEQVSRMINETVNCLFIQFDGPSSMQLHINPIPFTAITPHRTI